MAASPFAKALLFVFLVIGTVCHLLVAQNHETILGGDDMVEKNEAITHSTMPVHDRHLYDRHLLAKKGSSESVDDAVSTIVSKNNATLIGRLSEFLGSTIFRYVENFERIVEKKTEQHKETNRTEHDSALGAWHRHAYNGRDGLRRRLLWNNLRGERWTSRRRTESLDDSLNQQEKITRCFYNRTHFLIIFDI